MDGAVGGEEEEAALSDFEDDDLEAAPVVLPVAAAGAGASPATQPSAVESLKTALADLEQEKQARKAAEAAKADADTAAVRLKSYIHELIRQRDESLRQKDEALRGKEERSQQLEDAIQFKDELSRQKDEIQRQKEDMSRARDTAKAEIEGVARILVTQAEKIMAMTNGVKSFSGGLPRVPKSTGLAAIALGFAKRVEEVVEEVLRQREDALKRSNELRIQMEQRNFSIAIEVSQLEASVTQMREEVGKKSSELERWQKVAAGKDDKIADIEREMLEQLGKTKQEAEALRQRVEEVESKLEIVNSEAAQNTECAAKVKTQLQGILGLMQSENSFSSFQSDLGTSPDDEADEPPPPPQQQQKDFLAEGLEIIDLTSRVAQLWKENQQQAERERKDFESTVKMLHAEKGDILQKLSFPDHRKAPEEGSEVGSTDDTEENRTVWTQDSELAEGKNSSHQDVTGEYSKERYQIIGEGPQQTSLKLLQSELAAHERLKEQTTSKIALLEQDVENLQKEVKRTVSSARLEIERLQQQLSGQGRDLAGKTARILELEKHVESITGELVAAEEEVARWKEAATAEAAAGARMLEEVEIRNKEIAALNERSAKYRELVEEANIKVGSKEDMALAAITALNAAERSRQIADERASELRYRIEELNRQLEELEQKGERRGCGLLDWCLPWLQGRGRRGQDSQLSAEMEELLDPLV